MKMKVTFMLDDDLIQIIDKDKGLASRSAFVNDLLWKFYDYEEDYDRAEEVYWAERRGLIQKQDTGTEKN